MTEIRKEMEFWTHILRDHALFQYTSLSPKETETARMTQYFLGMFEQLHQEVLSADEEQSPTVIAEIINNNKTAVTQFVQFKKVLLTELLKCGLEMSMTPTFLNHMINEAMEYYRILCLATDGVETSKGLEMLRLHTIWLPDASGHAKFIASQLDGIEGPNIDEAEDFMEEFDELFKKANELHIMMDRTRLCDGIINHFNADVAKVIDEFVSFLEMLKTLRKECRITAAGTFSYLVPDHMIREEQYYMYRINALLR
jgi:hypothetical protein